jgi:putative hemolysin
LDCPWAAPRKIRHQSLLLGHPKTLSQTHLPVALFLAALPAVGASAFAAASVSLGALSDARKRALRGTLTGGNRKAIERYLDRPSTIEARWLLWQVLGLSASVLLLNRALPLTGESSRAAFALLIALVAHAVPAEIARSVVSHSPDLLAPWLLRALRPLEWLVAPIAAPIRLLARAATLVLHPTPSATDVTESEVQNVVADGLATGALDASQSQMINNLIDFRDATSGEIMVPRVQIVGFDVDTSPSALLEQIADAEHSRYPVFHGRIDNVVGVLHVKDVVAHLARGGSVQSLNLQQLARRPILYAPESQPAASLLQEMRLKRQHMAIVLDEFGGVAGLVTLEDILEEIVGEIQDEYDEEEAQLIRSEGERILVDATISIGTLGRRLAVTLPESDDYATLGGFLTTRIGRVPGTGTKVRELGYVFIVRAADERHVTSVEIRRDRGSLSPSSLPPDVD